MREPVYNRCNTMKCLIWRDKVEAILEGNFLAPVVMNIYPTNQCDHDCHFCAMKDEMTRHPGDMATGTLLKAISDCVRFDIKTVHFTGGGEPLLHPHVHEAVAMASQGGRKVALTTNGAHLGDPETLGRRIDYLRVSLDAATPETYARIHGVSEDVFGQVVQAVRGVTQAAGKGSNAAGKCDIGLSFVICRENWQEILDFCRLAASIGVDFVHLRPARCDDDPNHLNVYEPEILTLSALAEKELGDRLEIYSINFRFDSHWGGRNYSRCRATPLRAVLAADGTFRLCPDRVDVVVGDYSKNGFWQAWGTDRHKELINRIRVEECPRCVMSSENEIIENVFVKDNLCLALI